MKPRKTALSACAVALTLTLLVVPSSASGSLFFLSLNDAACPVHSDHPPSSTTAGSTCR